MAREARFKRQVRDPDAEHVADVSMVIVDLNYNVAGHLSLQADMKVASVRRLQSGVDGDWNLEDLGDWKVHGEMAEASPKEKSWLTADGCTGRVGKLLRTKSCQALYVLQSHYTIRWN